VRVPILAPPPLPPGHTRGATVLRELRDADAADLADFLGALDAVRPVPATAIRDIHDRGTWLPVSIGLARVPLTEPRPLPTRDLTERCAAISTAIHADYERHLDTLHVLGKISAALAEHPEALAPPSHPGIRLTLRRAHAELLAALAPVEAMLKAGA
jgi:hypothetical protein